MLRQSQSLTERVCWEGREKRNMHISQVPATTTALVQRSGLVAVDHSGTNSGGVLWSCSNDISSTAGSTRWPNRSMLTRWHSGLRSDHTCLIEPPLQALHQDTLRSTVLVGMGVNSWRRIPSLRRRVTERGGRTRCACLLSNLFFFTFFFRPSTPSFPSPSCGSLSSSPQGVWSGEPLRLACLTLPLGRWHCVKWVHFRAFLVLLPRRVATSHKKGFPCLGPHTLSLHR